MRTLALVVLAGFAIACGGRSSQTGETPEPLASLVPMQGCGEVEGYVRERLAEEVNAFVDAQMPSKTGWSRWWLCSGGRYRAGPMPPVPAGEESPQTDSAGGSPTHVSSTNNQVAGVDEADFVKNDDHYLYVVGNGALRIVKAWPANEATLVAKVPLDGEPRKLFVEGNRALVYVSMPSAPSSAGSPLGECTYGYGCVPQGDGTTTRILVFDISDRQAPVKLRQIDLSGSFLAARRIGDAVHTVVVDAPATLDQLTLTDERCTLHTSWDEERQGLIDAWERVRSKALQAIAVAGVLPKIEENGSSAVDACTGYYRPSIMEGRSFTSVVSLDIGGGAPKTATVIGDPGFVYASETSLYMSVPHARGGGRGWFDSMPSEQEASTVHQFQIGPASSLTSYVASGIVKGRVLNQFALDEYEGSLRVATSAGHLPDPEAYSTLSVLARQGNALTLSGRVDGIARGEDIRSVRFDGARGYIVTFKKTDPLFVFDLENPYMPSLTGELQIPGFSTYMHLMDPTHLLTIGYDADDQGSFAWFQGVMLQIFDVSNMQSPRLLHKERIGTRGSSSEALTDHLAFNYFAPEKLLALPMTICGGGFGSTYGTDLTFAGLMVYDVDVQNGFRLRGAVAHPQTTSGACSNFWTDATSEVKRSVIMDDVVYSISEQRVKVNTLPNLSTDLADISLAN